MNATAPGGIPMVRHSRVLTPTNSSLTLMTDEEHCAVVFAIGVLSQTADGRLFRDQPKIAETFREKAGVMQAMIDRISR